MKRNYSEQINLTVLCVLALIMMLVFSGCGKEEPTKADLSFEMPDFSYALPEGYSIQKKSDSCHLFIRDTDQEVVGGIEVTELRKKVLNNKGTTKIMKYLQEEFHKTNNVEFFSFAGDGEKPYVSIHLTKNDDTYENQWHFHHVLFAQDSLVYHAWCDEDIIESEIAEEIVSALLSN